MAERVVCACDCCHYDFTVTMGEEMDRHVHRDEETGKLWVLCPLHLEMARVASRAWHVDVRIERRPNSWGYE